jgi:hypothetical protein
VSTLKLLWLWLLSFLPKRLPVRQSPGKGPPIGFKRPADLAEIKAEVRTIAWLHFKDFVDEWTRGFEVPGAVQPDRLTLMQELGSGRWPFPVLVMVHEVGSLQSLVYWALKELNHEKSADLDYVERVAGNMVQISHMGFPDLSSTHDLTTRWRKEKN